MFLPTTKDELKKFGWDKLDVILVTGDTYIDSSYIGAAVIGNLLVKNGYRVGVIAQPDVQSGNDIQRLGEPELFWGVTAGSLDSLVANFTPTKKRRKSDDLTPAGENNRRPDRATIAYANLIRRYFKNTRPLVLGGLEASLRRIAHYDYWDDRIRKSVLFDAKADVLVYGMGEKVVLELAGRIKNNQPIADLRGICYIAKEPKAESIVLPSYEEAVNYPGKFMEMFHLFYQNNDPLTARGLSQQQDNRFLIQNPPGFLPSQEELDQIYELDYQRDVHPYYQAQGEVKALETIKFSLTTHRGCYGECNFCSIAVHQGRTVISRSEKSILAEAEKISRRPDFKGYITDVGGPTANMYNIECSQKLRQGSCAQKRCLYPVKCKQLTGDHRRQLELLGKISRLNGVKKVFIASGIRHDLVMEDREWGRRYLKEIVCNHVSGQLKIAPEHSEDKVLGYLGKPGIKYLKDFKAEFDRFNREAEKSQFLTYYLIAAHPGCGNEEMRSLKKFVTEELKMTPEQVQVFTPSPSTYSTLMYCTETDPFTGKKIFVEKDLREKERQKEVIVGKKSSSAHFRNRRFVPGKHRISPIPDQPRSTTYRAPKKDEGRTRSRNSRAIS
ncbi:MAG: YgiQ family radical SAM protein [Elusimicrobiota bacterium]